MKSIILSAVFIILSQMFLFAQNDKKITELSLQECVQRAIEENLNIQATMIDYEKSRHKVSETRAALLPKINVTGSFTDYLKKPVTDRKSVV